MGQRQSEATAIRAPREVRGADRPAGAGGGGRSREPRARGRTRRAGLNVMGDVMGVGSKTRCRLPTWAGVPSRLWGAEEIAECTSEPMSAFHQRVWDAPGATDARGDAGQCGGWHGCEHRTDARLTLSCGRFFAVLPPPGRAQEHAGSAAHSSRLARGWVFTARHFRSALRRNIGASAAR